MSMHFYSTSQKVLFDMEADLFSAIFVICICVDLESVCILLLTTLCQRFLTARPTAFEFPCGFKYLIPLGCFESPPNSTSLSKSKCHEELWEDWEEEQRSLSCRKSKHLNCFTKNKEKKFISLYKNQVSSVTYVFLHSLWLPVQISDASVYLKTI